MKIYVVGSSKNKFLPLDSIREKFLIDQQHEGANIDFLNPWYCEITGLYYLWKHVDDDIVGLEHYRTYFWSNTENRPINEQDITNILKSKDIIAGNFLYPIWGSKTLNAEMKRILGNRFYELLTILNDYDSNFFDYFCNYITGKKFWCCNCFISKKTILDNWMLFLLDVLVKLEEVSRIGPGTKTLRHEGFIAEFLFGAWMEYNKLKIERCDLCKFSKDLSKKEFYFNGNKL
jgi:hypothetical protein